MPLTLAISLLVGLISSTTAETILGVTVFTRNGDRTPKHYPDPALTNLGFQQNLQVGSDFRDLYIDPSSPKQILGFSKDKYLSSQVHASAPAERVHLNAATAFLQGLYPPLDEKTTSETLNNGSTIPAPLNGHQIPVIHAEASDSPSSIWINGAKECRGITKFQKGVLHNSTYTDRVNSTRLFYEQFWPLLRNVSDYDNKSNLSYENAYDVFDLINVGLIHNASMLDAVNATDLLQLRTLADSREFDKAFNADTDNRKGAVSARTLSAAITTRLNETITSNGTTKFSLLSGGYEPMLAFFRLHDLTAASPDFYGLPEYASTMAFELFTNEDVTTFPDTDDDLEVRFLFRNGSSTDSNLTAFPLFGGSDISLPWTKFVHDMARVSIDTPEEWCEICNPSPEQKPFCSSFRDSYYPSQEAYHHGHKGISNAVSGIIGAVVMLGTITAAAGGAFFFLRRRWARTGPVGSLLGAGVPRKGSVRSLTLSIGSERVRV
ncbi:uncharacterized protein APUU_21979S [Aspergillus puulaauensis]|uniref:Histidine phosphatase superfamily n=1 Tax=Aspergillus puulaauensis TaxID=1220207 RepID=A0A7R7XHC0_9EURO|nr:uncharacterized protein APUU_21979S [Aspergillus puulaauensis]BCS21547.1 hypothetical protein APUU_21979S [Aspergillus puulaauensis]